MKQRHRSICSRGALIEAHDLVSYQSQGTSRGVQLVYDSFRADPRPIFQGGFNDIAAGADLMTRIEIQRGDFNYVVPGYMDDPDEDILEQFPDLRGGEHFFRSPDQTGSADFAIQADLRDFETGVYDYSMNTGRTQRWEQDVCPVGATVINGQLGCTVPVEVVDRISFATAEVTGEIVHVNSIDSPYGAGWGIGGLLSLVENPGRLGVDGRRQRTRATFHSASDPDIGLWQSGRSVRDADQTAVR